MCTFLIRKLIYYFILKKNVAGAGTAKIGKPGARAAKKGPAQPHWTKLSIA